LASLNTPLKQGVNEIRSTTAQNWDAPPKQATEFQSPADNEKNKEPLAIQRGP
jgi:hypothetical protein